jgi:hypothetical protein
MTGSLPFRALLVSPVPKERPLQSYHPSIATALEWAFGVLSKEPKGSYVRIFKTRETLVHLATQVGLTLAEASALTARENISVTEFRVMPTKKPEGKQ